MATPFFSQPGWEAFDWLDLIGRLTKRAFRWFRAEGCLHPEAVLPGTGTSAVDLVYDTLTKVFREEARFISSAQGADPFPFIATVMRHDFLDLVKQGREYKRTRMADDQEDERTQRELARMPAQADGIDEARNSVLFSQVCSIIGADDKLRRLLEALLIRGLVKRAELAYDLEVDEQEVTNMNRRLAYKLKPFRHLFAASQLAGKKRKHG